MTQHPQADPTPGEHDIWPREFLDRFRSGQQSALREIYQQHAEELARLLRSGFTFQSGNQTHRFRGYSSPYELQDALQETFRRAFEPRARDSFDGLRPYRPYLRTIARNVVIASFRKHHAMFELLPEEGSAEHERGDASAEKAVESKQVRDLVRGFLSQLSDHDRRLLQLRFCDGISQRDAAQELGIGRQVLRTREAALRKQLAEYLRAQGESAWIPGAAGAAGAVLSVLPFLSSCTLEVI